MRFYLLPLFAVLELLEPSKVEALGPLIPSSFTENAGISAGVDLAALMGFGEGNDRNPGFLLDGHFGLSMGPNFAAYLATTFFAASWAGWWNSINIEPRYQRISLRLGAGGGYFVPPSRIVSRGGPDASGDQGGFGFIISPAFQVLDFGKASLVVRAFFMPAWGVSFLDNMDHTGTKRHYFAGLGLGIARF